MLKDRRFFSLFTLCLLSLLSTRAIAQEPAVPDAASATGAASDLPSEEMTARELSIFWGSRREVRVVQRRQYEKNGRIEAVLGGGIIPNDEFILYYPIGGRVGYFFAESLSVDFGFNFAIAKNSELTTFLEDGVGLNRAEVRETIQFYYNAGVTWAPIYGKLSLLGMKLTQFDMYFGLGIGLFHTKAKEDPTNPNKSDERKPAGNVAVGFRWYISDLINLHTEYRNHFFEKSGGGISKPVELNLGLGLLF